MMLEIAALSAVLDAPVGSPNDQYGRSPFDCLATSRENLIRLGYLDLF